LRIGRRRLLGLDPPFLGNFDGKSIRIEGDRTRVQLPLAVANALGRNNQTQNHGSDIHIRFAEHEGFFAFHFGVVSDVDDPRRTLLLHINGHQVSAAGNNGFQ
jgi:hypothetical protein